MPDKAEFRREGAEAIELKSKCQMKKTKYAFDYLLTIIKIGLLMLF